jgi:secretion/DNA translocation related TadE-like protein
VTRRRGTGSDRGAATVYVVSAIAVLAAVTALGLVAAEVAVARQRAAAAADLSALAAAGWARGGSAGDAAVCQVAARVAAAQRARLERCVVTADGTTRVRTAVEPGPWLGMLATLGGRGRPVVARAEAMAGPVAAP